MNGDHADGNAFPLVEEGLHKFSSVGKVIVQVSSIKVVFLTWQQAKAAAKRSLGRFLKSWTVALGDCRTCARLNRTKYDKVLVCYNQSFLWFLNVQHLLVSTWTHA